MCAAHPGLAIGDDLILTLKACQLEQGIQFSCRQEGAIDCDGIDPIQVDRAG